MCVKVWVCVRACVRVGRCGCVVCGQGKGREGRASEGSNNNNGTIDT